MCRRHGISGAAFYRWQAEHGALEVSGARRLKAFQDENTRLRKRLAEARLDNATLKDISAKNGDARREASSGGAYVHGGPASGVQRGFG